MQVSVEAGEGLERRMKIDLPFEQITVEVEKRLQQLARSARLPGFRPGKVPMRLLRQRFEDRVRQEVFGEQVQSSFLEALTQESLNPAGMPQIEPDIDLDAQRFGFTAIFEVMPEFDLASLSDRVLKRPVCELTDADLEEMIERLRNQRKTWIAVERPCQSGDQITISFAGTVDGEAFEGGASSGFKLELGAGRMIPGFEDGLTGASVGEQRTLDLTFPDPYQAAHLAGKPVRFEVTLDEVSEPRLPEVDAEFAQAFGVEDGDIERFRADVRANMERELKQRLEARTKEQVMDLLFEANPIDLPQAPVQSEMQSMAEQMGQALGGGKLNLPASLFESGARRRVALGLILGKIIKDHELKVDAARVRERVEQLAATYEHPQAVIDYYYSDRNRLGTVETVVLEEQVVELVLTQVTVEDETIGFTDLTSPASAG
ncbi:trigger factor [Thiobaca trueperi]|uniref:Trigger factor n=1 Tax=Thiobaca trueperi TaxID=127458 RepID=A0A4R3N6Q1_9GAMM|nr:trigger factor [Thiobaca trueperi]TCT24061.1 trigger factor [Thiobaca trueperi]